MNYSYYHDFSDEETEADSYLIVQGYSCSEWTHWVLNTGSFRVCVVKLLYAVLLHNEIRTPASTLCINHSPSSFIIEELASRQIKGFHNHFYISYSIGNLNSAI